jgi:hypothetical protein
MLFMEKYGQVCQIKLLTSMSEDDNQLSDNEAEALRLDNQQLLNEEMIEALDNSEDDEVLTLPTSSFPSSSLNSMHAPQNRSIRCNTSSRRLKSQGRDGTASQRSL